MTDTLPDEVITLRKKEWDAYRQYVSSLEARIVIYEAGERSQLSQPAKETVQAETARADSAPVSRVPSVNQKGRTPGQTALVTIGWVAFLLSFVPMLLIGVVSLLAVLQQVSQSKLPGDNLIPALIGISLIGVATFVQVRFHRDRRYLAVMLNGLISPIILWPLGFVLLAFATGSVR